MNNLNPESKTLIIAGGGTGGHVAAGIALAQEFRDRFMGSKVVFVGAKSGLEEKMVPQSGFPLELISVGKLKGQPLMKKIRTLTGIPLSILSSFRILLRHRPFAVIGVGGYASGPFLLSAFLFRRLLGIKTAILEQNAVPGLTNRILSRLVDHVFLSFPVQNSSQKKAIVTGNPIRKNLKPLPHATHDPFTIFVFGGSQGAAGINTLVLQSLPYLNDLRVEWIHQTGEKDYTRVLSGHRELNKNSFRVETFIHDMLSCYEKASLVICRSGASTLSELARVGRAAILIPFPQASDDHQTKNAVNFCSQTGSVMLKQNETTGEILAGKIREMYNNPQLIREIETRTRFLDQGDPASRILEIMLGKQYSTGVIRNI